MKKINTFDTVAQKEALINEYKGNLFEYLVGSNIARTFGIEEAFINSFGGEIREKLKQYEMWLRENDSELLQELPVLAGELSKTLIQKLPSDVENIYVVGKIKSCHKKDLWKEADLIMISNDKEIPVSIKLSKEKSFVNTKSGGIKSFFEKYFNSFENVNEWQNELNCSVDESFYRLGHELYSLAGLEFKGSFNEDWMESGYSELPGQLDSEMNKPIKEHYHRIISKLYEIICCCHQESKEKFTRSLYELQGMGNEAMIQAICFHGTGNNRKYVFKDLIIADYQDIMDNMGTIEIGKLSKGKSSFEIRMKDRILQIRVKPMNKFTTQALKVNCSVKSGD